MISQGIKRDTTGSDSASLVRPTRNGITYATDESTRANESRVLRNMLGEWWREAWVSTQCFIVTLAPTQSEILLEASLGDECGHGIVIEVNQKLNTSTPLLLQVHKELPNAPQASGSCLNE